LKPSHLLQNISFSLIGGIFAAIIALLGSVLFSQLAGNAETELSLRLLPGYALIEELSKLFVLFFLFSTSSQFGKMLPAAIAGVSLGIGFALIELIFITDRQQLTLLPSALLLLIHSGTALLLALGILNLRQFKKKILACSLLLLAIILHLCYNAIVLLLH
jgi:RsiW-degrading membrane proteinase PrsW (M82 family)